MAKKLVTVTPEPEVDLTPGPGEPELEETKPAKKFTGAPRGFTRWMAAPGVTGIATTAGAWEVVNGYVDLPDGAYPEGYGFAYFDMPEHA